MAERIDAHHHLWHFNAADYGWISEEMAVLRRDFLPKDLAKEIRHADVDGVVTVQARQSLAETAWLLELAAEHDFMRGVVGWAPLASATVADDLAAFAAAPKLKAVRHVLQGEPDENYMLRDDFNAGIAALTPLGLVYDILIFERHLPQTIRFVDRHPNQPFVLDHIAKPRIRERLLQPWKDNLADLARRENVYCKLSGLVTEADPANWTPQQLEPYVDVAIEAFTPQRVMFGSDWPVCLLGAKYKQWVETVEALLSRLTEAEQDRIWSATAIEAYRL